MGKRQQRELPHKKIHKDSAITVLIEAINTKLRGFDYEKPSQRKPKAKCRSFAPRMLTRYEEDMEAKGIDGDYYMEAEQFYDHVTGTSPYYTPIVSVDRPLVQTAGGIRPTDRSRKPKASSSKYSKPSHSYSLRSSTVSPCETSSGFRCSETRKPAIRRSEAATTSAAAPKPRRSRDKEDGKEEDEEPMITDDEDETDLIPDWIENVYDNSDRHSVGIGLLSKVFGSGKATETEGFDEDRDSRPFFTYWITLVQFIIFIVVISTYGVGPISPYTKTISDSVIMTNLVVEEQSYEEPGNMWIGPRLQDLIHVGSKYSLCMRMDTNLQTLQEEDRVEESVKACCFNNDGSGCVMKKESKCSAYISSWLKYDVSTYPPIQAGRTSGAVCGQDPAYCNDAFTDWPNDITTWPICDNTSAIASNPTNYHMSCEVLGRPCCVGIRGECVLATREYCTFRRGFFHEEAHLCSQVDCVSDICGMIPFANTTEPDQFYRLFTVMFVHAGLFDVIMTLVIQLLFMRDLEKLISSWRVVVIYLGSGVAGSLAGATFIPYYVESGPAGAQFGIIAALTIELIRFERRVKDAKLWKTILKISIAIGILFIIGLIFPQIDNYSHLFGFFFGGLIAFGLRPYKVMCGRKLEDCAGITIRVIVAITCILLAVGIFVITVILFYVSPVYNCPSCMYFNCIPFTSTYCDGMSVSLDRQVIE